MYRSTTAGRHGQSGRCRPGPGDHRADSTEQQATPAAVLWMSFPRQVHCQNIQNSGTGNATRQQFFHQFRLQATRWLTSTPFPPGQVLINYLSSGKRQSVACIFRVIHSFFRSQGVVLTGYRQPVEGHLPVNSNKLEQQELERGTASEA